MHDRPDEPRRSGPSTLVRPRLEDALSDGLDKRMLLVVAPAGYGKSLLLSHWAASLETPVAWCTMAEPDNDPGRLLHSIVNAVERAVDDPGESLEEKLAYATPESVPLLAEEWVGQLSGAGEFVLVLDDLHELLDRSSIETTQRLVEASPPNVHVCVASRHDPPLAVARLRLDGRLCELRQAELTFTIDEVRRLLTTNSIDLCDDLLVMLHERTDGWPAALRLAIISMQQTGDAERVVRDLAGTNRIVSEYLVEEVLRDMAPAKQSFLLQTSILEEVNGELGEVLTGRLDGQSTLEELAAAGEFTTRISGTGWYRYHSLLRDFLRARLRELEVEQFLQLHRKAADWWWQFGEPAKAINHAIEGREIARATAWLGEAASSMATRGQAATIVDLSQRLTALVPEPNPLLLMLRMWALYDVGARQPETDRLLDATEVLLSSADTETTADVFVHGGDPRAFIDQSALPWLRGLKARTRGDLEGLLALDRSEHLPSPSGRVEVFIAEGLLWIERFADVDPLLETFRRHTHADQFAPSMVYGLGLRAFAAIGSGQFMQADALIEEASELIDRHGIARLIHTQFAQLAGAWLHWERGELRESELRLGAVQGFVDSSGDVPICVHHALLRSRTRWSLGDRDGAREILETAGTTTGRVVTGHFADRIALTAATIDAIEGEPARAAARLPGWEERLADAEEPIGARLALCRFAIQLGHEADPDDVLLAGRPTALHRIESAKCATARALAAGRKDEARSILAGAMTDAMGIGATQRLVDEKDLLAPVFSEAAEHAGFTAGTVASRPNGDVRLPAWFVEELTDRELEVLEQLPTQLSNPEIAELLYVSTNTVKTHVKAIFRKLAVSRRTDAVNRAREFGLISD